MARALEFPRERRGNSVGFDAVTRRVTATPGSRPKKRKGKLYWMARALEFPALRAGNSVGSTRTVVSAKQGGPPLARMPALFGGEGGIRTHVGLRPN